MCLSGLFAITIVVPIIYSLHLSKNETTTIPTSMSITTGIINTSTTISTSMSITTGLTNTSTTITTVTIPTTTSGTIATTTSATIATTTSANATGREFMDYKLTDFCL